MTGWKVGFVMAAPALIEPIARVHQFLTAGLAGRRGLWIGEGRGLVRGDARAIRHRAIGSPPRSSRAVMSCCRPKAAISCASTLPHRASRKMIAPSACALVHEAGVAAIPISALYAQDYERRIVRLCFAKTDDVLDEAARRLIAFRADHVAMRQG
jgi:N-succinyldiaminopimelate aminotransferase